MRRLAFREANPGLLVKAMASSAAAPSIPAPDMIKYTVRH